MQQPSDDEEVQQMSTTHESETCKIHLFEADALVKLLPKCNIFGISWSLYQEDIHRRKVQTVASYEEGTVVKCALD